MRLLRPILAFTGIEEERLRSKWVSSAEASEFASEIEDFVDVLCRIGPSPLNNMYKRS